MNTFSDSSGSPELSLRDYLAILSRQRWLVLSVFVAAVLGASAYSAFTTPRYESTASVLLRTAGNAQLFPTAGDAANQFVRSPGPEYIFATSTSFRDLATRTVAVDATVTPRYTEPQEATSAEAQVLDFVAASQTAEDARVAAQGWADLYLRERAEVTRTELDAAIAGLIERKEVLEAQRDEIMAPLGPIDARLLDETDADTVARLTAQRVTMAQALDDELLPIRFQLRELNEDIARFETAREFAERDDMAARINTVAPLGRQVAPQHARNLALGAILGALLGVGVGLLNDSLRIKISNEEDLDPILGDVPVLAELPARPEGDTATDHARAIHARYDAELERVVSSVAYQASRADQAVRVLVTSPHSAEGKSTLVHELAGRLAASHLRTIVLDGDLRRPVLHERFPTTSESTGLAEALGRGSALAPLLLTVPGRDRLRVLPAGTPTSNAAALLRRSFATSIDSLHVGHDVLLVDSPPVLAVNDAEIMATSVDRVIVVVRAGRTARAELRRTLSRLDSTGVSVLGVVLVGVTAGNGFGHRYSYEGAYGPVAEAAPPATVDPAVAREQPAPQTRTVVVVPDRPVRSRLGDETSRVGDHHHSPAAPDDRADIAEDVGFASVTVATARDIADLGPIGPSWLDTSLADTTEQVAPPGELTPTTAPATPPSTSAHASPPATSAPATSPSTSAVTDGSLRRPRPTSHNAELPHAARALGPVSNRPPRRPRRPLPRNPGAGHRAAIDLRIERSEPAPRRPRPRPNQD